jgi:hypothetical protein
MFMKDYALIMATFTGMLSGYLTYDKECIDE